MNLEVKNELQAGSAEVVSRDQKLKLKFGGLPKGYLITGPSPKTPFLPMMGS